MSNSVKKRSLQQDEIRAKCFHPSGEFVDFCAGDIETSIPERFEEIANQKFLFELPLRSLSAAPAVAEMAIVIEKHEGKQINELALDRILKELESLSDTQARGLVLKGMDKGE